MADMMDLLFAIAGLAYIGVATWRNSDAPAHRLMLVWAVLAVLAAVALDVRRVERRLDAICVAIPECAARDSGGEG
jgi:4-amino-4-deoxy-L-arabinose transferase-like glycosyltransferase